MGCLTVSEDRQVGRVEEFLRKLVVAATGGALVGLLAVVGDYFYGPSYPPMESWTGTIAVFAVFGALLVPFFMVKDYLDWWRVGISPARVELLKSRLTALVSSSRASSSVYVASDIPPKKLRNAKNTYAQGVKTKHVMLLLDATRMGGAKNGCLLTPLWVYWKNPSEAAMKTSIDAIDAADLAINDALDCLTLSGRRIVCPGGEAELLAAAIRAASESAASA